MRPSLNTHSDSIIAKLFVYLIAYFCCIFSAIVLFCINRILKLSFFHLIMTSENVETSCIFNRIYEISLIFLKNPFSPHLQLNVLKSRFFLIQQTIINLCSIICVKQRSNSVFSVSYLFSRDLGTTAKDLPTSCCFAFSLKDSRVMLTTSPIVLFSTAGKLVRIQKQNQCDFKMRKR